jgi:aminoglycoside phosphotransferase (APT) family kinase protein
MTIETRPAADLHVDAALVRALLREQHPDLAHLVPLKAAEGWDNAIFRLGDDLAVRLPRRAAAVQLIEHEQRWLPHLSSRLPVPVPEPLRTGVPGPTFGWTWSIVRWLPGETLLRTVAPPPAAGAAL